MNKVTVSININVRPSGNGRFVAYLGDRPLCRPTSTPFFTAARVLLNEGASPDTPLAMRHEGSPIVAMRSTIEEAAGLTVVEENKKGIRVRKYHPPRL